ncbi:hypothetical protein GEMRC1_012642 [Eukaryota sp. GEM-RC1]
MNLTCSDFLIIDCEFDCFIGSAADELGGCVACENGLYGVYSSNGTSCRPCDPGFSVISLVEMDLSHASHVLSLLIILTMDKYCPVGSVVPLSSEDATVDFISEQPELPPSQLAKLEEYSTIALYLLILAVTLLIIASVFISEGPFFRYFDFFNQSHYTENNQPIIQRETKLGGFYSWLFIAGLLFMASSLFFEYQYDNISYTRTLEPAFLTPKNFTFHGFFVIEFQGYSTGCSNESFVLQTNGVDCPATITSSIGDGTSVDSCLISVDFDCQLTNSISSLSIQSNNEASYANAVAVNISTFASLPNAFSNISSSVSAPQNMVLKGNNPSVFSYELIPSVFTDNVEPSNSNTGYHLRFESASAGSVVSNTQFHHATGFKVEFQFHSFSLALMTDRSASRTFMTLAGTVLGTVAGMSGVFAFLLELTEDIFMRNKEQFKQFFKRNSKIKKPEISGITDIKMNPLQSFKT